MNRVFFILAAMLKIDLAELILSEAWK